MPDAPPGVHAKVLGFLETGEGAARLNMLSRAAEKTVAEMQSDGHPEAHPDTLWVGKLLATMRRGVRGVRCHNERRRCVRKKQMRGKINGNDAFDAIRNLNWDSLPAWAKPEVAKVAIEEQLIFNPQSWDNPASIVQWDSLPEEVRATPSVVETAIVHLLIRTPMQWNSLPVKVRADKNVVLAAIAAGALVFA
eukprot:g8860.t1